MNCYCRRREEISRTPAHARDELLEVSAGAGAACATSALSSFTSSPLSSPLSPLDFRLLRLTLRADEVDPYQNRRISSSSPPKASCPHSKLHTYTPDLQAFQYNHLALRRSILIDEFSPVRLRARSIFAIPEVLTKSHTCLHQVKSPVNHWLRPVIIALNPANRLGLISHLKVSSFCISPGRVWSSTRSTYGSPFLCRPDDNRHAPRRCACGNILLCEYHGFAYAK